MTSTLSYSSISSDVYDFNAETLNADDTLNEEPSYSSPQDKLEDYQNSSQSVDALVAFMAEASSIYFIIPFALLCALISYMGVSFYHRALNNDEQLLAVF